VIRTRVGYAGGTTANPTYERIGDHTETLEVDYDPSRVSYSELLKQFFAGHDSYLKPYSRQYRAVVFYHDEEQRELAQRMLAGLEKGGRQVYTALEPYRRFYPAEDYHQKYGLRSTYVLMRDIARAYPNPVAFRNSTVAARLNAYISGYGSKDLLEKELPSYGLNSEATSFLKSIESKLGTASAAAGCLL